VGAVALAWWLWRRRRPAQAHGPGGAVSLPHAVGRLYRRSLEKLAEHDLVRRPTETPREFGARVRTAGVEGAEPFGELTELYLQVRFGRHEIDEGRLTELARRLSRLGEPPPDQLPRAA